MKLPNMNKIEKLFKTLDYTAEKLDARLRDAMISFQEESIEQNDILKNLKPSDDIKNAVDLCVTVDCAKSKFQQAREANYQIMTAINVLRLYIGQAKKIVSDIPGDHGRNGG